MHACSSYALAMPAQSINYGFVQPITKKHIVSVLRFGKRSWATDKFLCPQCYLQPSGPVTVSLNAVLLYSCSLSRFNMLLKLSWLHNYFFKAYNSFPPHRLSSGGRVKLILVSGTTLCARLHATSNICSLIIVSKIMQLYIVVVFSSHAYRLILMILMGFPG